MFGKNVYTLEEGNPDNVTELGERGARLCALNAMGITVPRGFIVTAEAAGNCRFTNSVQRDIINALNDLKFLNPADKPFSVCVRCGGYGKRLARLNLDGNDGEKIINEVCLVAERGHTSVIVQTTVFGNLDNNSGAGIVFIRHPKTSEKMFMGEFLDKSFGEEFMVSADRLPFPVQNLEKDARFSEAYSKLVKICGQAEKFEDACAVEFAVESGKLFILNVGP